MDVQVHGTVYYAPFARADEEDRPLTLEELQELVLNEEVIHKKFGNGIVSEYQDNLVVIDFAGSIHRFPFPACFAGFVKVENEEIQQKLDWYNQNN